MITRTALAMVLCCLASTAFADQAPTEHELEQEAPVQGERYRWTLSVDPLTFALGYAHVQLERSFGDRLSLYMGPNFRVFTNPILSDPDLDRVRGYGAELGLRVFFYGAAPEGAWVMVRGVLAYIRDDEGGGVGGYGSLLAGYTWVHKRLVLGGGLGVQYLAYSLRGQGPSGLAPAAHTVIGVAF
ncbi:MAG: hypothetical protein AB8H86_19345 [Polyangiales bacterium]